MLKFNQTQCKWDQVRNRGYRLQNKNSCNSSKIFSILDLFPVCETCLSLFVIPICFLSQTLYFLNMDLLQKIFNETIRVQLESATSDMELEKISDAVPGQIESLIGELPNNILSTIKTKAENGLAERRVLHVEFIERNVCRWKEGFDLLELQIEIAIEAGESFNDRLRPQAALDGDLLFDLLVRLHAKGCLISIEILMLLKNGYADGAHARWRALHELSVTARFLTTHGKDAAQRYVVVPEKVSNNSCSGKATRENCCLLICMLR